MPWLLLIQPKLITKYGYKAEVHYVTTEDGYILELHRIAGGYKSPARKGKKVVFLQHGLLDTSATWILTRPNHALGQNDNGIAQSIYKTFF